MNVFSLQLEECEIDKITFLDTKPNIIMDGLFSKFLYTDTCFTLNSILLHIPLNNVQFKQLYPNKMVIQFELNTDFVQKINNLEKELIDKYIHFHPSVKLKQAQYSIKENITNKKIKIQESIGNSFFIKISGIWESDFHYGVTFKFIRGNFT
jgi:hypothetical protein